MPEGCCCLVQTSQHQMISRVICLDLPTIIHLQEHSSACSTLEGCFEMHFFPSRALLRFVRCCPRKPTGHGNFRRHALACRAAPGRASRPWQLSSGQQASPTMLQRMQSWIKRLLVAAPTALKVREAKSNTCPTHTLLGASAACVGVFKSELLALVK